MNDFGARDEEGYIYGQRPCYCTELILTPSNSGAVDPGKRGTLENHWTENCTPLLQTSSAAPRGFYSMSTTLCAALLHCVVKTLGGDFYGGIEDLVERGSDNDKP